MHYQIIPYDSAVSSYVKWPHTVPCPASVRQKCECGEDDYFIEVVMYECNT